MRRLAAIAALVVVVPLLVAATDPPHDALPCDGGSSGSARVGPDLISAEGFAEELGTAAVWRLRFDRPVEVPSDLQIDVVVRDPYLPATTLDGEPGLNRVVRWTASSAEEPVRILWVLEDNETPFNPPVIDGDTVEIRVPGRILLGEDEDGTESVARTRWSVVVRQGSICDRLGTGEPDLRLTGIGGDTTPSAVPLAAVAPASRLGWPAFAFGAVVVLVLVALGLWSTRQTN